MEITVYYSNSFQKKIIRLTYIGATLGATTGVGIGVGKHLCNLLIIKLGVRGVTKQQSCVYTRTCVRERCKGEKGHTKTKKPRLIWGWAGAFFMNVSVCASGGHVGHKVTTANEAEDGDTVVRVQDA